MAQSTTPDEKAHMALRVFQHFGSRQGEVLRMDSFTGFAAKHGWTPEDIAEGLGYGRSAGWFVDGPNDSTKLTAAGYAEIMAGPALGQGKGSESRSR
jgi:hypothetical protein